MSFTWKEEEDKGGWVESSIKVEKLIMGPKIENKVLYLLTWHSILSDNHIRSAIYNIKILLSYSV